MKEIFEQIKSFERPPLKRDYVGNTAGRFDTGDMNFELCSHDKSSPQYCSQCVLDAYAKTDVDIFTIDVGSSGMVNPVSDELV